MSAAAPSRAVVPGISHHRVGRLTMGCAASHITIRSTSQRCGPSFEGQAAALATLRMDLEGRERALALRRELDELDRHAGHDELMRLDERADRLTGTPRATRACWGCSGATS